MLYLKRIRLRAIICLLVVLGINAGAIGAAFVIGNWLDPFGLYRGRGDTPPQYPNPARAGLSSYSYIPKAAQIVRSKPNRVLLGSSVVDHGIRVDGSVAPWFDPDPRKAEAIFNAIEGDHSYFNAAVRGRGIRDAHRFLEHAFLNNPKLDHVILGIDWSMLMYPLPPAALEALPIVGKTYVPLATYFEYTATPFAVEKAYDVFVNDRSPEREDARQVLLNIVQIWNDLVRSVKEMFQAQVIPASNPIIPRAIPLVAKPPSVALIQTDSEFKPYRFVFSAWFATWFRHGHSDNELNDFVSAGRLEELRAIVAFCRDRNIRLDVFISPQHPVFAAFLKHLHWQDTIDRILTEVARITPFWDFSALVDYSDPDRFFLTETLHFSEKGGEIILPILRRSRAQAPHGALRVTWDDVQDFIARREHMLADWLEQNPAIKGAIEALPPDRLVHSELTRRGPPEWLQVMPAVYEPSYKGYTVVRFLGLFFAIPSEVPQPYDLYTFVQHKYPRMLDADSLQDVLQKIDAAPPHGKLGPDADKT